jgi:DNA-binding beta-propeller fold protein YncE
MKGSNRAYWAGLAITIAVWSLTHDAAATQHAAADAAPAFTLDASWPKPLPNNWMLGVVWGIATDSRDHVWILQDPRGDWPKNDRTTELMAAANKQPAPPVIEFDPAGNVVQAWGGPGSGYSWMQRTDRTPAEHGIWIDHQDHVWVTGNGHVALKFTRTGKFLLQIGELWKTNGNSDRRLLGNPTGLTVDPETNEVYIADGYDNNRVVVFDALTGAYKRHWGAYGKPTENGPPEAFDPIGPPPQRWNPTHCVRISRDGYVYVCDRGHNRFQVFRKDGTFVREVFVAKDTPATHQFVRVPNEGYAPRSGAGNGTGSASSAGFSADREQRFLFVGGSTSYPRIFVYRRSDLQLLGAIENGRGNHEIAVDSKGNIYTVDGYSRGPQRLVYQGVPAAAPRR